MTGGEILNYLREILAFNDLQEINRLSTGQIALWYALMYINNKCSWNEWFTVAVSTLKSRTGLSRDGVYKARNRLSQLGYIGFRENGKGKSGSYKMLTLSNNLHVSIQETPTSSDIIHPSIHPGIHVSLQDSIHLGIQDSIPINKRNETKEDNNNSFSLSAREKIENAENAVENYAAKLWRAVLEKLSDELTPTAISTWFDGCTADGYADKVLTVYTPSEFKRKTIEEKFAGKITDALRELTGEECGFRMGA